MFDLAATRQVVKGGGVDEKPSMILPAVIITRCCSEACVTAVWSQACGLLMLAENRLTLQCKRHITHTHELS